MDERVTNLEVKIAYLERNLADLDEVVRKLDETVGLLTGEIVRLRQQALEVTEKPVVEKPPHY